MHGGDIYNNIVDIDFSVNLNPYVIPSVREALEESVREGTNMAGCYPDPDQTAVRSAIAGSEHVDPDCVFAGNGSSEIIMALVNYLSPSRALLTKPCFYGYEYALESARACRIEKYDLKEEEGFELHEDFRNMLTRDVNLLFLADPNNPTGKNTDEDLLEEILDTSDELGISVILDQSFFTISDKYLKCTDEYVADKIKHHKNLFIVRSYTKSFALPGIRMGYVISRTENISGLRRCVPEWNLSSISTALMRRLSVIAADGSFYNDSIKMIAEERQYLATGLSGLGYTVFSSNTNFILLKSQKDIYEKLLSRRILIRRYDDQTGPGQRYFRVAVRSHEDNMKLIDTLSDIG